MNREQAKKLIRETFEAPFDKEKYSRFVSNLLKRIDFSKAFHARGYVNEAFKKTAEIIKTYERIGTYTDASAKKIDVLIVYLEKNNSLDKARTTMRNFVAQYLKNRGEKDAALVAFVPPDKKDWRFSLVKMDYHLEETPSGKFKAKEVPTPARRWSFLVGKNEKSHTAQSRFVPILENDDWEPTLEDLEQAFDVEVVTKEFFQKYRDLFIRTKLELDKIVKNDAKIRQEFEEKNINTVDFAKKLIGQITFLYFLQKKGWFGVERGKPWGTGPKDFMRRLFNREFGNYKNFYDDILEPLFYEALSTNRSAADHYYSRFNCKIPFLNGGLFDPINNYDWVKTDILIPDKLFSNNNKTKEGDIGDGILDVFDRYNFTVNEEEPLEKEVALDPELLGKTYEKLNAIRADNFDEYLQVLQSGRKGEETKFNKEYGVYYTPREIVHYMCQESLINYLATETSCARDDIEEFVKFSDSIQEMEATSLVKQELIEAGDIKSTKYESKISECIRNNAKQIDNLLANIKVCDPAVGSGAFPIGMMHEVVKLRQLLSIYTGEQVKTYDLKHHAIENSLYGVDIDPGAVEICKLRFWLSMIVDEEDFHNIKPLPNLDYKIVCGNSLLGVEKGLYNHQDFAELEKLKPKYFSFSETNPIKKQQLKNEIDRLIYKITKGHKEFDFEVYFSEVFREKGGFDIVIANPPYISTKGVSENVKKLLQKYYGFADDLYSHFYFRSMEILKKNGILTYISSKTFWTIQTKKNLRELILKNQLLQLVDAGNPFDAPMVDTCVILVQKQLNSPNNYIFKYIDGTKNFTLPTINEGKIEYYKNAPNNVFFPINEYNLKIYKRYGKKVNELLNQWWTKVSTSKNIEKYKKELETYRKSLKPGDITLLGLITEGGQGLATGNNGKYIGVLEGTKWAENVRKQRPEKLLLAAKFCSRQGIKNKSDAIDFLNNLNEQEIRELFDELKEKYGRDIFGQGWLFRIISPEEIADVETLTEDEKLNGIFGEKTFVPYDKGDKDGNRWYAPTPYYIDWSRKNVKTLQTDPKARWQGYQFYFREGFCWNNVSTPKNEKSMYIKCRLKEKSVNDVASMSLYIINKNDNLIQNYYLISLLNSRFLFNFLKIFINESVNLQINDIRQLPIIIPTSEQLKFFENIFNQAVSIQKEKFAENINKQEAEENLDKIQKELDKFVEEMYLG